MRSDHLSKHSKIHAKKTKRSSAAPTNEEASNIKTENPPVDEHRQLDNIADEENLQISPKPTYTQELSILTDQQSQSANCANPAYNSSQRSPAPLFYSHLSNQAATVANHPYGHPNSVFYHLANNPSNNYTENRSAIGHQNSSSSDSHNGTTTSTYNEKYTYDNYHQYYPSQAQVYHINYGNGHNYPWVLCCVYL